MSVNAIGSGNSPAVSAAVIDLSSVKSATGAMRMLRVGDSIKGGTLSSVNVGNGAGSVLNKPLLAGRTTRTREQFQAWIGNDANAAKVSAIMTAAKFTNRADLDSIMVAGLTYIGSSGNYPKSVASAALAMRSKVFQASAKLDKAKVEGDAAKVKSAGSDFNAVRADAYRYFNKYVVKDANPGLTLPGNVPRTNI